MVLVGIVFIRPFCYHIIVIAHLPELLHNRRIVSSPDKRSTNPFILPTLTLKSLKCTFLILLPQDLDPVFRIAHAYHVTPVKIHSNVRAVYLVFEIRSFPGGQEELVPYILQPYICLYLLGIYSF